MPTPFARTGVLRRQTSRPWAGLFPIASNTLFATTGSLTPPLGDIETVAMAGNPSTTYISQSLLSWNP